MDVPFSTVRVLIEIGEVFSCVEMVSGRIVDVI